MMVSGEVKNEKENASPPPMDKDHKDPHELDLTKPRLADTKMRCIGSIFTLHGSRSGILAQRVKWLRVL